MNPEEAAPVEDTGQAAPVDTGAAPESAPPPSDGPGPAPSTPPPAEAPRAGAFDNLPDDMKGYVENKGWKDPEAAVESYQRLEKLLGTREENTIKLPDDPANMGEVWDKLGRPEDSTGYQYQLNELSGEPDGVYNGMAQAAHEAGLTDAQFTQMQHKFADVMQAQNQERAQQINADLRSWQEGNPQDFQNVRLMMQNANVDADQMARAMTGSGRDFYEVFAKIAGRMGEQPAAGEDAASNARFGLSPEAARAKIKELNADPQFQERLGHADQKVRQAAADERRKYYMAANPAEGQDAENERLRAENARLQGQLRRGNYS